MGQSTGCSSSNAYPCCFNHRSCEEIAPFSAFHPAPKPTKRHLILNFDINKTILMRDRISGKTVADVVNEILADTTWGSVEAGGWTLRVTKPTVFRPQKSSCGYEVVSYNEYLSKQLPGSDNKKKRATLLAQFTSDAQPGAELQDWHEQLTQKLMTGSGGGFNILPSFFQTLLSLKHQGRSFTLVFRTFGDDLNDVVRELNLFCEGKHPMFSGVRMDGSDGAPDYRVTIGDIRKCGTFYRDANSTSLIMGTFWQPENEPVPSLKCYENMKGIKIVSGSTQEIYTFLRSMQTSCGTLALRDYFLYWKQCKMASSAGKLLFMDSHETNIHSIFFDDNIAYDDAKIISSVDIQQPLKKQWITGLLRSYICRSEPLSAIKDRCYFLNELSRLESNYEKKIQARKRLAGLFTRLRNCKVILRLQKAERKKCGKFDVWADLRVPKEAVSVVDKGIDEVTPADV